MTPEDLEMKLAEKFTTMNLRPRHRDKTTLIEYTSEEDIRENVWEQLRSRSPNISEKMKLQIATESIARSVTIARERGILMSTQQIADWRIGRRFVAGDRAKYVGPNREELTLSGLFVPRPSGQVGHITKVIDDNGSRVLCFTPTMPEIPVQLEESTTTEPQIVTLEVREHTIDWLTLERIPE